MDDSQAAFKTGLRTGASSDPAALASSIDELTSDALPVVYGEPSFALQGRDVELWLTRRGGHMGPVRFRLGKRWVEPYALAPWRPDEIGEEFPPVLRVLRGDYFCFPFGESKGIRHGHGETANEAWEPVEAGTARLVTEMKLKNPACTVRKTLSIRDGHRAVYVEHRIEGLRGRYNFGHHAVLRFPETGGPYHVNVSPFKFGSVKPEAFSNPLAREYGILKTGARFKSLGQVPLATGGTADLRLYPARRGFEDLIMVTSKPGDLAWTAATLDGYIWLSLKDPRSLPSTLFWISNGGRHASPWNGRHVDRLGLEEVCSHFCDGLETSRQDRLKAQGVPTTHLFRPKEPRSIRVIHAVHPVPKSFGRVERIEKDPDGGHIRVEGSGGRTVRIPLDWAFLHG
jgi:hypothetical protein